eukprot:1236752-Prymnesium_polylepis.3
MNAKIVSEVHCVAAEPHATFLHIAVTQGRQQVAYASAVLGRLRRGYRIFQMRSNLGTRIELCYLFVRIRISSVHNLWATPRQVSDAQSLSVQRIYGQLTMQFVDHAMQLVVCTAADSEFIPQQ